MTMIKMLKLGFSLPAVGKFSPPKFEPNVSHYTWLNDYFKFDEFRNSEIWKNRLGYSFSSGDTHHKYQSTTNKYPIRFDMRNPGDSWDCRPQEHVEQ